MGRRLAEALAHLLGRLQPQLRARLRLREPLWLRLVQSVHEGLSDRNSRSGALRRAALRLARAPVRLEGRDREPRRARRAGIRDARLPQAALPTRFGDARHRRPCVHRGRGSLSPPFPRTPRLMRGFGGCGRRNLSSIPRRRTAPWWRTNAPRTAWSAPLRG